MNIRPIAPNDDPILYVLIREILEEESLNLPGSAYYDKSLKHLSSYYQTHQPSAYFVITDKDEKVVGGGGFAPFSAGICELQKFYLDKKYRGQGWSKILLEKIIAAAQKNYAAIYLESHSKLQSALVLYKKYGFEALEAPLPQSEHSLMDHWMIKKLD
ncbi:MAG: GNAT family N-acetyltransferase [Lactococcus sp.]